MGPVCLLAEYSPAQSVPLRVLSLSKHSGSAAGFRRSYFDAAHGCSGLTLLELISPSPETNYLWWGRSVEAEHRVHEFFTAMKLFHDSSTRRTFLSRNCLFRGRARDQRASSIRHTREDWSHCSQGLSQETASHCQYRRHLGSEASAVSVNFCTR